MQERGQEAVTTRRLARAVAVLAGLSLALGFALAVALLLGLQIGGGPDFNDPDVRRAVLRELIDSSRGIFDTHPDPDVARVGMPVLKGANHVGVPIYTNRLGFREREFELPKPTGVCRVVLLGDSFVFGFGQPAEERLGVFLEDMLRQRAEGFVGEIEVLHLGVVSWNAFSGAAWARRNLVELQPDLVVQVLVENDLDDNMGVRGFGALAEFSPRHPERTNARVSRSYPEGLSQAGFNPLIMDVDYESKSRFDALQQSLGELAELVRAAGGRYVCALHWPNSYQAASERLSAVLEPDELLCLPAELHDDKRYWRTESDSHWSRVGHEDVARLLFSTIRGRGLLPELALAAWPETEAWASELFAARAADVARVERVADEVVLREFRAALRFGGLKPSSTRQIYAGLDVAGHAAPFVSLVLKAPGGARVVIQGQALEAASLAGARVEVSVEGHAVGAFTLVPGQAFAFEAPLPEAIVAQPFKNVRLTCDDWIHAGEYRRECRSYVLKNLMVMKR